MKRHQGWLRASRLFLVERPAENQSQEARPHRLNEGQPIGEVVLKPRPKRGQVDAELRGELMGTLNFTSVMKINVLAKLGQTWLRLHDLTLSQPRAVLTGDHADRRLIGSVLAISREGDLARPSSAKTAKNLR
jgi:hypothetical protein